MNRRRALHSLMGAALVAGAWPAWAGAAPRTARVAFMAAGNESTTDAWIEMLRQALRALGHIDGRNLSLIVRQHVATIAGLEASAVELVAMKPDVIIVGSHPAIRALQRLDKSIPLVMVFVPDPVGAGHAASLARPGGNVTGPSGGVGHDISVKRLELLRVMLPNVARVGVLMSVQSGQAEFAKAMEVAGKPLGMSIERAAVASADDLERAFGTLVKAGVGAVIALGGYPLSSLRRQIGQLGLLHRLPVIATNRAYPEAGLLASFGPSPKVQLQMAARYVDKILRGAKPGDLPIEQPSQFELVINGKTAAALGIELTQEILLRADEVLE